ncbi:MAG TPA: type I-MYXAN CRISPR-associated protein Cas6/Cmx6 [Pirellulales bacterium]|nr:type I-MYXAN CRISPR-associated protein Cas6/Cmx6 [Pirellulales bacterium]
MIELQFPVLGQSLPTDHGYLLYSALSGLIPPLHSDGESVAVGPISGQWTGNGVLALASPRSRLRLRLPAEQIASVLPLAGKALDIGGHRVRLGVPTVQTLVPAPALAAKMVTIKGFMEPETFLAAAQRQLDELGIHGKLGIPVLQDASRAGEPRRKVMRIREKKVVGFALHATELTAEESIILQERGLGGRRKMGCGFFAPVRPRSR